MKFTTPVNFRSISLFAFIALAVYGLVFVVKYSHVLQVAPKFFVVVSKVTPQGTEPQQQRGSNKTSEEITTRSDEVPRKGFLGKSGVLLQACVLGVTCLRFHAGGTCWKYRRQCNVRDGPDVNVNLLVEQLVKKYSVNLEQPLRQGNVQDLYALADTWVTNRNILPKYTPQLGAVLNAIATDPIVSIDNGPGNQLKFSISLKGGHLALFKPKWYEMDAEWPGTKLCAYHDSPFAEIAAFHLSRVLEMRRTPLAVGRKLSLRKELLPLATERMKKTSYSEGNVTCFYGDCLVCSKQSKVCTNDTLDGVMIFWIHKRIAEIIHPWHKACNEKFDGLILDGAHCADVRRKFPFNIHRIFLDFMESTIFEYLIMNGDRKVHPVFNSTSHVKAVEVIFNIDNGKSFAHPDLDEPKVLAPLFNCCLIRGSMYQRLRMLGNGVLSRVMKVILSADPLRPVLTDKHLTAMDRRLAHVLYEIRKCIRLHGATRVLVAG